MVAKLETTFRKKYDFDSISGVLGNLTPSDVTDISNKIKENGYYKFPNLLNDEQLQRLIRFSKATPAVPRMAKDKTPVIYNGETPISPIYDFKSQALFEAPVVQQLLLDKSILAVAQEYLGPAPVLDLLTMWWSTAACKDVDLSKAAQLYHFDLDRLKFLKFFIYLSDVDTYNGPHCYIEKSHKIKPKQLRRDGRILDEELKALYPASDFKEITGPKGTILAVDTSGFHKGKPLEKGERLLFQMEFATSMFGQNYPLVELNHTAKESFLSKTEGFISTFSPMIK